MTIKRLGERIRERRRALGKTLKEVAGEADLSVAFISQIERDQTMPSLTSLAMIAKALAISVGELMGQPTHPQADTYHDKRPPYSIGEGRVRYERLSSVFRGSMLHSVKFDMPCGYKSETVSHEGEEMVYVLRGRIRYEVADRKYVLDEGDSLHFDAKIPHSISAMPHPYGAAEVIWTGTLDIFDGPDRSPTQNETIELQGTEFYDLTHSE